MASDRHVTFQAAGVPVTFPFQPYDIQRDYVECVVRAAQTKQNALLESPTGTGKTLSLLCSSLAWQQSQSGTSKMVYYTSRTHIQLSQAAKEMKRTAYARVPSVVLASRTHMCLNDEVKQQSHLQDQSINRACKNAIAKNACAFYHNYETKMERLEFEKVHDIEDLYEFGRKNQCCPYYTSKKIAETKASLVFMPYNYLLDLSLRKTTQLKLDGSVVIFDEGHNVESALKDSASAHFKQIYLKTIQESCAKLPEKLHQALLADHGISRSGFNPEKRRNQVQIVDEFDGKSKSKKSTKEKEPKVNPLEELSTKLTNDKLRLVNRCAESLLNCQNLLRSEQGQYKDTKRNVDDIFCAMREAGVEYQTSDLIIETLESMSTFWSIASVMNPAIVAKYLTATTNLTHFISLLFPPECKNPVKLADHMRKLREFYVVHISGEFEKTSIFASNTNKLIGWEVNLWCLHSAIGLKRVFEDSCLNGPRSLIITSGTLAPMRPIEDELETKFKIVREFKHLITKEQLKVTILGESPSKHSLLSTFEETKKPQYSNAIGETLLVLFKVLPYGTLVFFPSYSLMNKVTKYWEGRPQLWKDMSRATKMFIESKDQVTFNSNMSSFKRLIDAGNRAVFLGVCRGKLSEGTNLEGNHCRSVVIVGLPFPSMTDPRVQETKDFHSKRGDPRGEGWYTQQMRRALSQAFGRVIRNRNDFGMLFLCDPRFTRYKFSLSEWIRPFYPSEMCSDIKQIPYEIKDFFKQHSVEVTESDISGANNPNSGAFELDYSRARGALASEKQPAPVNTYNAVVDQSSQGDRERTLKDRQAEMVASYTVSKETFNKIKSTRLPAPIEEVDLTRAKKPRTTTELFDCIFEISSDGCESSQRQQQQQQQQVQQNAQPPQEVTVEPTTINPKLAPATTCKQQSRTVAPKDAHKPKLKPSNDCYVCKNPPVRPHVINCNCARVGCWTCVKGLNNKTCGECKTLLKAKKFKPKMFNVFQKREV